MPAAKRQGARDFQGMDVSIADTAPAYDKQVLDVSGNHERQGAWETRRGFVSTGWDNLGLPVNAVVCWQAIDGTTRCIWSSGQAYYQGVGSPFPAGGYGTGGYGGPTVYGG